MNWRLSYLTKYEIRVPQFILEQIQTIGAYIQNVIGSTQGAESTVKSILDCLKSLEIFPERGFDADQKVGKQIAKSGSTKGIVIANKRYLLFYTIDSKEKIVYVTHLVPAKSDYARLFI